MKTSGLFLTLAAASVLTACLKEEDGILAERQELRLRSGIEAVTRGEVQSTAIVAGETVYAWVTDALTGEALYNACTLTAQAGRRARGHDTDVLPCDGQRCAGCGPARTADRKPRGCGDAGSFAFTVSPTRAKRAAQTMCTPICSMPHKPSSARKRPLDSNVTICSRKWS